LSLLVMCFAHASLSKLRRAPRAATWLRADVHVRIHAGTRPSTRTRTRSAQQVLATRHPGAHGTCAGR